MSILGLRGFSNAGLGMAAIKFDEGEASNADVEIFKKELGITLQDKRTQATIAAFTNPQLAVELYEEARKPILKKAATEYKNAGLAVQNAGLGVDAAMDYAKRRAEAILHLDMELHNMIHPYADAPDKLIALASGVKRKDLVKPAVAPVTPKK